MKFRKKPVVIEAIQYDGKNFFEIREKFTGHLHPLANDPLRNTGFDSIEIHTMEGMMLAQKGDWIIKGVKGELYPCKPDIFEATYEEVFE